MYYAGKIRALHELGTKQIFTSSVFSVAKQNEVIKIQNFLWRKIVKKKYIYIIKPFPLDETEIFWFHFAWFCVKTAKNKTRKLEKISVKEQSFSFSSFGILISAWSILLVINLPNRKKKSS